MITTPIALTIAGSDSGGGAGIQADLKTFSALGVYGASAITALTAQNTREVRSIFDVSAEFIGQQIDTVCDDLNVNAVKIGMLSQPAVIEAIAQGLRRHAIEQVVLDPVMVAKSGDKLLQPEAVEVLRSVLLPKATLITPNLPEAAVLLDEPEPTDEGEMVAMAERLLKLGCQAVLLKGGHLHNSNSIDIFFAGDEPMWLSSARIDTQNTHGTGCTLSSAIAAFLAKGYLLDHAVVAAKDYVSAAIAAADLLLIGHGHGPVHHFHALWEKD